MTLPASRRTVMRAAGIAWFAAWIIAWITGAKLAIAVLATVALVFFLAVALDWRGAASYAAQSAGEGAVVSVRQVRVVAVVAVALGVVITAFAWSRALS